MQLALRVVVADLQRAEAWTGAARRRPAEDDELLAPMALHLEPAMPASRAIRCISPLADDPLQPQPAGFTPHGCRIAFDMVAVAQRATPIRQPGKHSLAVDQPARTQVPAVQVQKVEQVEKQAAI